MIAAVARFWGLDFGLPLKHARPDEMRIAIAATSMLDGNFRTGDYHYPALFPALNASARWVAAHTTHGSPADRKRLRELPVAYRTSRWLAAISGVLTIAAVFALAQAAYGARVGLMAALLLAGAHLHARDSHFGVTDSTLALFVSLALVSAVATVRTGAWRATLLGGLFIGLSGATKYPGVLVLIPVVVAHLLVFPPRREAGALVTRLGFAAAVALAVFIVINPYSVLDPAPFFEQLQFEYRDKMAPHMASFGQRGWVQHASLSLRYGLGIPYALAALAGIGLALKRRSRADWVLISFLLYYLMVGKGTKTFVRYMLPLVPVAALLAATTVDAMARRLAPHRAGLLGAALALMILAPSAVRIARTNGLLVTEDTRLQAARFLDDLVETDQRALLIGRYSVPIVARMDPRRFETRTGEEVDAMLADVADPAEALGERYEYVVWGDYFFDSWLGAWSGTVERLERSLRHLKSFSPLEQGIRREDLRPVFDSQDKLYLPYAGFAGIERTGPFVHVYRLGSL